MTTVCTACDAQSEGTAFCESCGAALPVAVAAPAVLPPVHSTVEAPPIYGQPYVQPGYPTAGYAQVGYQQPTYAQPVYVAAYGQQPAYQRPIVVRTGVPATARVSLGFGIGALVAYLTSWAINLSFTMSYNFSLYGLTIVAGVLGLLGFGGLVTAIVTGHVGVYQTGARFARPGRGMALAGMIMGYSVIVVGVVLAIVQGLLLQAYWNSSYVY